MTHEEVSVLYNEMLEHYGDLPNHNHEPNQFESLVKMFLYRKDRNKTKEMEVIDTQTE